MKFLTPTFLAILFLSSCQESQFQIKTYQIDKLSFSQKIGAKKLV